MGTGPDNFTNSSPNMVTENKCTDTWLLLEGLADTSGLTDDVKAFSDGYKATLTLGMEFFAGGAQGGWRGVCMVYYSSQYIQDNTNGAICAAAQQNATAGSGPFDFGGIYLMHVQNSSW